MKKIAIMTWFHYNNFGTALQVSALTEIINKLGFQAEVIDYIPDNAVVTLADYKKRTFFSDKLIKKLKIRRNEPVLDEERKNAFNKFLNNHIIMTNKCKTSSDLFQLNNMYNAFVCGSDQIWAPSVFNPKYFLDFVEDSNKMIAYAPSIGLNKIEDKHINNRMRDCIERFNNLSIREDQGKQLIKQLCGKDAKVVLDPTLLLSSEEWDLMSIPTGQNAPYILCYFLGYNKENWKHVEKLSKKTNIPLKLIPVFSQDARRGHDVI